VHRPAPRPWSAAWFGLLGLVPFVVLSAAAPLVNRVVGALVLGAVLWPVVALRLSVNPAVRRGRRVRRIYLFEQGFVVVDRKNVARLWRWSSISMVLERLGRASFGSLVFFAGTGYKCTVVGIDGRTEKLSIQWEGADRLGRQVSQRVARAKLPEVLAALERGCGVRFGEVVIDADGLTGRGGRGSVPWSDTRLVLTSGGYARVEATDEFWPVVNVRWSRIPNPELFAHLVHTYQQRAVASR
jgi:hypothetical protein